MHIEDLNLYNVRTFTEKCLGFNSRLNLITGDNASGKTTLLEAIYLLLKGRSHRTSSLGQITKHGAQDFSISARFKQDSGVDKDSVLKLQFQRGKTSLFHNNNRIKKRSDLIVNYSVRFINESSFNIINAGPKFARSFMDWQIPHIDSTYLDKYRTFTRAKEQLRQLSLRSSPLREVMYWLDVYSKATDDITECRLRFLDMLRSAFAEESGNLRSFRDVSFEFYPGYKKDIEENLVETYQRHSGNHLKFFPGPHLARLSFMSSRKDIGKLLSRGESKMFMISLQVLTNHLLNTYNGTKGIVLIDDLTSELDDNSQNEVFQMMQRYPYQFVFTAIDPSLKERIRRFGDVFHVEHLGSV